MDKKVILNLSTVINVGGAGNYALQNHELLLKFGYDSYLIVKDKPFIEHINVFQYPKRTFEKMFQKLKRWSFRQVLRYCHFEDKYAFYNPLEQINCHKASTILQLLPKYPDVIFIYWVSGFINSKLLKELTEITKAKVYILMIDNAPITGGCHYPWDCVEFQKSCHNCPAIKNRFVKQLAHRNLAFKQRYKLKDVVIIAATQFDYNRVTNSILYKSTNCLKMLEIINQDKYIPASSKGLSKKYFGVNEETKVIFIGSTFLQEERKGMYELLKAIEFINKVNVVLLVAGKTDIGDIQMPHKLVGYLSEDQLIKAFQAADVFVCPSLEDSGPLMINQSVMCGTPVVAFDMGSATDLVLTGVTGYRAVLGDSIDLAKGIDTVLALNHEAAQSMSLSCRSLALRLCSTIVLENTMKSLL